MNLFVVLEMVLALFQIGFAFFWSFVKLFLPVQKKDIKGEIVLITGAGRGLGKEIAMIMSEKGCKVVVVDINLAAVEETAKEIKAAGGSAYAYKCDVSNWDDIVALRDTVLKDVGPVNILVNNAGLIVMQSFMTNTQKDIERTLAVNVNGVVYMSRIFLEQMIEQKKGHIVTISSTAAYFPMPWAVIYATSKCASNGFMLTLAEQLRFEKMEKFIKTTNVLPYIINTNPVKNHKYSFEFIEPRFAAEKVVEAIQEEEENIVVPSSMYYTLKTFTILPLSVQRIIKTSFMREADFYDSKKNINTVNDNI